MEDYVTRLEHEEFRRTMESQHSRQEDENIRQNHRLNELETTVKTIADLSRSVEKLAVNMDNMLKEQIAQGNRLTTLEGRDGEKWRMVVGFVLSALAGSAVTYMLGVILH